MRMRITAIVLLSLALFASEASARTVTAKIDSVRALSSGELIVEINPANVVSSNGTSPCNTANAYMIGAEQSAAAIREALIAAASTAATVTIYGTGTCKLNVVFTIEGVQQVHIFD